MTPLNACPRPHHRPSHLHRRRIGPSGVVWWCAVVLSCALVCSVQDHGLVGAQFAADPLILNATNAFVLNGFNPSDHSGYSVSGVGDVNGDSVDDFVVGARLADPFHDAAGRVYLLFGRNSSHAWTPPNPLELSTLDGSNGVALNGLAVGDRVGFSVTGVNDVNGDNIHDFVIGSESGDVAFVVFGVNGAWPGAVNLTQGAFNGVTILGQPGDRTGYGVGDAGDVNNDGVHDVAVGSRLADAPGGMFAGRADVLYGRPSGSPWPGVVDLATYVNASTGFTVFGDTGNSFCGTSVSGVEDVNGDGVDDVALGCPTVDAAGFIQAGIVAVVFGSASALPPEITPSQLNGTNGFVVNGQRSSDSIGVAVSTVGDVNADGLLDFAIGARAADANSLSNSGELYVLYGRNASVIPWPAQVNSSSLNGTNGFTLAGSAPNDFLGGSVSAAGDVNGDGMDDMMVGVEGAAGRGQAILLYGRAVWPARQNRSDLYGSMSNTFQGNADGDNCGVSVSHVGDVDGDGRGDFVIGCPFADPDGRSFAGQAAIVFGPLFTSLPTTTAPTTAPTAAPTMLVPVTSSPTTSSPTTTASPTPSTCATQGAFIPPGATCVNDVLVTTANTTAPVGTAVTIATSVTVTGGASFEQPSGSTLVFVAGASGGSTSIVVQDGGCAAIAGDAVVSFEADPSNGGADSSTGTLVLVTADCVMGAFGSVSATTSFEGDECVAVGDGEQVASGSSISVSFGVSNTCDSKSGGLSTGALAGVIAGGAIVVVLVVIALAVWQKRKRVEKREATLAGIQMHQ